MRGAVLLILSLGLCSICPIIAAEDVVSEDIESSLDYLDGSGVIIAVADTGVDMDHSCFRDTINETGVPGQNHRKIVHLNDTIDGWDTHCLLYTSPSPRD